MRTNAEPATPNSTSQLASQHTKEDTAATPSRRARIEPRRDAFQIFVAVGGAAGSALSTPLAIACLVLAILKLSLRRPMARDVRRLVAPIKNLCWFLLPLWISLAFVWEFSSDRWMVASFDPVGCWRAFDISLRAVTALFWMTLWLLDWTVDDLVIGMRALHVPIKLSHLLGLVMRYTRVLKQEYQKTLRSMRARGFRGGVSLRSMNAYGNLAAILLVKSLHRSERVVLAMRARGMRLPD